MYKEIYLKFNEEKAIQSVLYVANRLKRKDFHKIFKILYFADREHFSKYSRSITEDTYIAMKDGPVPSNLYDIFKAMRGDSFFAKNVTQFKKYFKVVDYNFIEPLQEADLDCLSQSDIEELDNSLKEYGNLSYGEIREKSHDYAWDNTTQGYPISVENILLEAGEQTEYINFVKEQILLNNPAILPK